MVPRMPLHLSQQPYTCLCSRLGGAACTAVACLPALAGVAVRGGEPYQNSHMLTGCRPCEGIMQVCSQWSRQPASQLVSQSVGQDRPQHARPCCELASQTASETAVICTCMPALGMASHLHGGRVQQLGGAAVARACRESHKAASPGDAEPLPGLLLAVG